MKSARILTITFLLLVAATVSVQAEERNFAQASIPFAFSVGDVNLPAGTYVVSTLSPQNLIKLRKADGPQYVISSVMAGSGANRSQSTKLVFQHSGDHYFLSEISEMGSSTVRQLRQSKLARELARSEQRPSTTTVLAQVQSAKR